MRGMIDLGGGAQPRAGKGGIVMKKAIVVLALVFVLILGRQQLNPAWVSGPDGMSRSADQAVPKVRACLFDDESLTREQRMRIAALHEKYYREMTVLRQKLQVAAFAYRQARIIDPKDTQTLEAKRKAVEEARLPLRKRVTEFRVELLKILTPEQQAKLWEGRGLWGTGFGRSGKGPGRGR